MFSAIKRKKQQKSSRHRSQTSLTLNCFFDEHYFPHIKATKRSTKDTWSTYNIHLREQFGSYRLDELSNPLFDVWVREQIVAGYQRSTINKHIFLVNRMLNLARHWGYIERSKELSNIQRLALGDYKQRFLSEEEIAALLKHAQRSTHPHIYNVVRLLLLTGARKGEARLARWCDIDRDKRIWTVPRSKSGRSRRIVLSTAAMAVIDDCVMNAVRLGIGTDGKAYVFTNPRTRTAYDSFYAVWHLIRAAAELPDVRIHDLRHTYASLLINRGVSLYEVQTLLGHSSLQMTQRYAHLQPNLLHQRAEIVGGIVGGKR
jgi:integrase